MLFLAKQEGRYKGKPKKEIDKDLFAGVVKLWRAGEITAVEAMKRLDLKPNTFYRRVKEYGFEIGPGVL